MNWVTTVPLQAYVTLSAALFAIGLLGVELMLNAANINFVAFWRYGPSASMEGQVFAVIVMTLAAAEAAVALAIILNVYRRFKTVNVDQINVMKG